MSARMGTAARMTRVNRGWGPGAGGRGQGHSHHPSLLQLTQGPMGWGGGAGVSPVVPQAGQEKRDRSTESRVKGEPKEGLSESRSCGRESCSRSPGWLRTPGYSGDMREAQGAFLHGPSKPPPY